MSDFHNKRVSEIINKILYVTIASVSEDGKPWNSPVYSAFDKDLNFYWFSDKNSQHSTNLRNSSEAFLAIYDSTVPESTGEGVYIQARVRELTKESEVLAALKALDARVGKDKERDIKEYSGKAVLRGYQATPLKIWVNDDEKDENGNYVRDIRVEISLEDLKKFF